MIGAQHSSESNEWYTPPDICKRIHEALGGIDLDPASSSDAQQFVKATHYSTRDTPWEHNLIFDSVGPRENTIYLNPPGGVAYTPEGKPRSVSALWWSLLVDWWKKDQQRRHAVFCCFNMNVFQTAQCVPGCPNPLDFTISVPEKRVKYVNAYGVGRAPPHPSAFVMLSRSIAFYFRFHAAFSSLGYVSPERR